LVCDSWKEANALWASGESDADVEAKALKSYEEDHKKDGPFMFKHCWEVLHKEPKWEAYLERLQDVEPDKRKFCEEDDVGKCFSLDDDADVRPIGGKQAKEDVKIHIDLNENPGASFAIPPEVNTSRNPRFTDVMRRKAVIRDCPQHTQLKNDLIEHIWCKFGNRQRN
jgi:hypothetical protein